MRLGSTIAAGVGVVFIILFIAFWPFVTVDTGNRGVVLQFEAFQGEVLDPGLHFINPFGTSVVEVNVQQQTYTIERSLAYTKDGQPVEVAHSLTLHADEKEVGHLFQDIGVAYPEKIIKPTMEDSVKQVIAKYTAIEIPQNREKLRKEIEDNLRTRLAQSFLVVTQYALVNEDYDDKYEEAIKSKQVQEQKAKEAEYITKQEEEKKKQAILQAEALAEKTRLEAEALAIQGNADNLVRKLEAEAMLTAAQRWNGQLPMQMVPGSAVPFINVGPSAQ